MSKPLFKKVAFIGLGLIGSSLARVIVAEQLAAQIVASTRSKKTLEDAKALGLIQHGYATPEEAVRAGNAQTRLCPGPTGSKCAVPAEKSRGTAVRRIESPPARHIGVRGRSTHPPVQTPPAQWAGNPEDFVGFPAVAANHSHNR